ncbi:MAG: hypothetical protein Q8M07_31505 [Prosthecobacter sp.]|nr:hypothetical protein [Prosthecobacter sp.]
MPTCRKTRADGSPRRKDVNTDPHWTNWEYLAAFGEDELGYTYLDAIKRFCCIPSEEDAWLDELVRRARAAHDQAGQSRMGREAAWRVLRRAGMILLHDRMDELKVGQGIMKPRAVFLWPTTSRTLTIATNWRVDTAGR